MKAKIFSVSRVQIFQRVQKRQSIDHIQKKKKSEYNFFSVLRDLCQPVTRHPGYVVLEKAFTLSNRVLSNAVDYRE